MPFQAIPIAMRANTGTPLSKLLWIHIVHESLIGQDAPNGKAFYQVEYEDLCRFCQTERSAVIEALSHLQRCGLIRAYPGADDGGVFIDVELPISDLRTDERKRIKATPDQIRELASKGGYRCAACGQIDYSDDHWHVDHIIPRSIGGADVEINCQLLCETCNTRKGARVHWVDFLGGRR